MLSEPLPESALAPMPSVEEAMKVVGVRDPVQPPPDIPSVRGRVPTKAPQPLFFLVFSEEDPEVMRAAVMAMWPEMGKKFAEAVGMTLLRHDPQYRRRWPALKPSTIAQRKREGNQSDYPYSDRYAYNWWMNRWGTSLTVSGDGSIEAGIGPSESTQSHSDWSKTEISQFGTPPGHGDGKGHTQQKQARPLGASEEIATEMIEYARKRLPEELRKLGSSEVPRAILAPDMIQAELPMWNY